MVSQPLQPTRWIGEFLLCGDPRRLGREHHQQLEQLAVAPASRATGIACVGALGDPDVRTRMERLMGLASLVGPDKAWGALCAGHVHEGEGEGEREEGDEEKEEEKEEEEEACVIRPPPPGVRLDRLLASDRGRPLEVAQALARAIVCAVEEVLFCLDDASLCVNLHGLHARCLWVDRQGTARIDVASLIGNPVPDSVGGRPDLARLLDREEAMGKGSSLGSQVYRLGRILSLVLGGEPLLACPNPVAALTQLMASDDPQVLAPPLAGVPPPLRELVEACCSPHAPDRAPWAAVRTLLVDDDTYASAPADALGRFVSGRFPDADADASAQRAALLAVPVDDSVPRHDLRQLPRAAAVALVEHGFAVRRSNPGVQTQRKRASGGAGQSTDVVRTGWLSHEGGRERIDINCERWNQPGPMTIEVPEAADVVTVRIAAATASDQTLVVRGLRDAKQLLIEPHGAEHGATGAVLTLSLPDLLRVGGLRIGHPWLCRLHVPALSRLTALVVNDCRQLRSLEAPRTLRCRRAHMTDSPVEHFAPQTMEVAFWPEPDVLDPRSSVALRAARQVAGDRVFIEATCSYRVKNMAGDWSSYDRKTFRLGTPDEALSEGPYRSRGGGGATRGVEREAIVRSPSFDMLMGVRL